MVNCQFPGDISSPLWRAFSTMDSGLPAVHSTSQVSAWCSWLQCSGPVTLGESGWGGGEGEGRLFCGPWPVLARAWPCLTTSARISPQSWFLCTSQFKTSMIVSRVKSARGRQEPYCSRLHCIFPLPFLLIIWQLLPYFSIVI